MTKTYKPTAIYYADADYVEYTRQDAPSVERRVDEYLTLSMDLFSRKLVGFRLKGFKNFYFDHLRKTQDVFDGDRFLSLVTIIEKTVEVVGHSFFETDKTRAQAYAAARKIAQEDHACGPRDHL